ncbi:MAG: hypothetical protein IPN92_14220 [Chromatiaceae bacterium]|nr:hypothetical protein [Chromatiaceae bacterium]
MEIRFSRHARRRAKLYGIPESTVEQTIANANLTDGENKIIELAPGFKFPLKIIAVLEGQIVTVIKTYPLKKGLRYESSL